MTIGDALDQVFADIEARKTADPSISYSASLIQAGPHKCAKKLGEEAVELSLAIIGDDDKEIHNEAADLLYHFAAALISRNINLEEVAKTLENRRGTSGHDEKASRKK